MALRFPSLALEAQLRGHAPRELAGAPWAVADGLTLLACDAHARTLGVRPGMGLAAAWALAPQLRVQPRQTALEREALEGMAGWVCRFTPQVSLEPPAGVLAEVGRSLRLFGGLALLVRRMRAGLEAMGFEAILTAAPTARSAWWLALAGQEALIAERGALGPALAALPAEVACREPDALELLHGLGITTLGQLLALPRAGVARRFGQGLLDEFRQALGEAPEARAWFVPPPHFAARLELPEQVTRVEGVLFTARRLLLQLEGFLAARHAGVRAFLLTLEHHRARPSALEVRLASPGREAGWFLQLLRERLGNLVLVEPVEGLRLEANDLVPLSGRAMDLLQDACGEAEDWLRLVERLRARLGDDAVQGLAVQAEHRPERAWRSLAPGERTPRPGGWVKPRPLWLIEPPRRLQEAGGVPQDDGPLELLAGPERIESGWWDGDDVARDYFIARAPGAVLLWVFRERGGGWYLHGLFA